MSATRPSSLFPLAMILAAALPAAAQVRPAGEPSGRLATLEDLDAS